MTILIHSASELKIYDETLKKNGAVSTSFRFNHGRGSKGEGWLITINTISELLNLIKEIENIETQSGNLLGGVIITSSDFSGTDAKEDLLLTIYDDYME